MIFVKWNMFNMFWSLVGQFSTSWNVLFLLYCHRFPFHCSQGNNLCFSFCFSRSPSPPPLIFWLWPKCVLLFFVCFTLISLSMYIYIQLVLWSIAKSYHAFSRLVFQVPFLCTSWFWPCFNFEYGLSLFDTYCYSGIPPNKAHTKFMCIQYFTEIYQWLHFFKGGTVV